MGSELTLADDPSTVQGYTTSQPDPSADFEIEWEYDHNFRKTSADEYYWCCHCQKPTHFKGWVLRGANGQAFAIGADCAVKHYGKTIADRKISSFRRRQRELRAYAELDLVEAKLPDVLGELRELADADVLDAFRKFESQFRSAFPALADELVRAAAAGGALFALKTGRDAVAERAEYERLVDRTADPGELGITQTERKRRQEARRELHKRRKDIVVERNERSQVATLPQAHVLDRRHDPKTRLLEQIKLLSVSLRRVKDEGRVLPIVAVEQLVATVRESLREISSLVEDRNSYAQFCAVGAASSVARWWREVEKDEVVSLIGTRLVVVRNGVSRHFDWPTNGFGNVKASLAAGLFDALTGSLTTAQEST